jgi:hypothetical protein
MSNGLFNDCGRVKVANVIPCDASGRPVKHWSGRDLAAKVLREGVWACTSKTIRQDDAWELTDAIIAAYLEAQK